MSSIWQTKTCAHRYRRMTAVRKANRGLYKSAQMFNEAFDKVFCEKRPWMRWEKEVAFGGTFGRRPQAGKELQRRVAKLYLSIEKPARGVLKEMAASNGLNLANLYAAVSCERRRQRLAKERTAA